MNKVMKFVLGIFVVCILFMGMSACGGNGNGFDDGLVVILTWTTPSDPDETDTDGTDFDLHMKDEGATWWFDDSTEAGSDCFSGNTNPDWGVPGDTSDDPLLTTEDSDGAGPEIIALSNPSVGMTYTVGVHSSLDNGYGPSLVSVEVYVDDLLVYELTDEQMVQGWVWEVVNIGWLDSGPVFSTIDTQVGD